MAKHKYPPPVRPHDEGAGAVTLDQRRAGPPAHQPRPAPAHRAAGRQAEAWRRRSIRPDLPSAPHPRTSSAPALRFDTAEIPAVAVRPDHDRQAPYRTGPRILPTAAESRPTGPRFDAGPFPEEGPRTEPAKPRRALQASVLLGLVAITAALVVLVPNQDDGTDSADTTRVEADGPTATAELLASDHRLDVAGSLADAGGLAEPIEAFFNQPDPSGSLSISSRYLTGVVEPVVGSEAVEAADTSTTAWVEPALPPQSAWVDAGAGVLVPDLQLRIRFCESTNNYTAANRSSSARGAYQFLQKSWAHYGFAERFGVAEAHLATPAQQDQAALEVLQSQGTAPWKASRDCWSDPNLTSSYATAKPAPKPATTPAPTTTATTTADDVSSSTEAPTDSSTTTAGGGTTTSEPAETTTTTGDTTSTTTPASTTTTT